MNQTYTKRQRLHLERVKTLPCSVCDEPGPSQAHHIEQSQPYTCVALCPDCHQGYNGWHGTKALWRIRKMDELGALNVTEGWRANAYRVGRKPVLQRIGVKPVQTVVTVRKPVIVFDFYA